MTEKCIQSRKPLYQGDIMCIHLKKAAKSLKSQSLVVIRCGEWDSNPRTPSWLDPESSAFDLAWQSPQKDAAQSHAVVVFNGIRRPGMPVPQGWLLFSQSTFLLFHFISLLWWLTGCLQHLPPEKRVISLYQNRLHFFPQKVAGFSSPPRMCLPTWTHINGIPVAVIPT